MAVTDPQKRIKELETALNAARAGVEETLKTLRSQLETAREDKATFEKTSALRQKERNEARKERDALKAQVEELEKRLASGPAAKAAPAPAAPKSASTEELERLQARIDELERASELTTARGAEGGTADERVAALEAELAQEREINAPLREETAKYKERVKALEKEVAGMRPRQPSAPPNKGREAPSDETERLLARIAELERAVELSGTSGAADGGTDQRIQELEAQLAEAREANAPALEELAKAKDRIRALEKEIAAARPGAPPLTMPLPQA